MLLLFCFKSAGRLANSTATASCLRGKWPEFLWACYNWDRPHSEAHHHCDEWHLPVSSLSQNVRAQGKHLWFKSGMSGLLCLVSLSAAAWYGNLRDMTNSWLKSSKLECSHQSSPVNMPNLIQKRFVYSQLWPLQPACRQNQARLYVCQIQLPASDLGHTKKISVPNANNA